MKAFVTYLGSDEFLPGLFVLNRSLRTYENDIPLVVMTSKRVSNGVLDIMKRTSIHFQIVNEIVNPHRTEGDSRNFNLVYTKLNVFSMTEFDKVVYLDLDMLVCDRISILFEKPHMSAVIAGSLCPGNESWVDLNSGLLVIEPSNCLFEEMLSKTSVLPSKDGSDQGFLHSFFPDWKNQFQLHLDHRFNLPCVYLEEYCRLPGVDFSYSNGKLSTSNISILHYWAVPKPWNIKKSSIHDNPRKYEQALKLWWDWYDRAAGSFTAEITTI